MDTPDRFDDTSADYERFEIERLAQDRDATRTTTADLDEWTAQRVVACLVNADIVTPVPEEQVFVPKPTDTAFESSLQLAVYHRTWAAGHSTDGDDA